MIEFQNKVCNCTLSTSRWSNKTYFLSTFNMHAHIIKHLILPWWVVKISIFELYLTIFYIFHFFLFSCITQTFFVYYLEYLLGTIFCLRHTWNIVYWLSCSQSTYKNNINRFENSVKSNFWVSVCNNSTYPEY